MSLIDRADELLRPFPVSLQSQLTRSLERIEKSYSLKRSVAPEWSDADLERVIQILSRSRFVAESLERFPEWLDEWLDKHSALHRTLTQHEIALELDHLLNQIDTEAQLMKVLRDFRRKQMVRLIWRDLCGMACLKETMRDVSALADLCIGRALDVLYEQSTQKYGIPRDRDGNQQHLLVIGMGKLGARELNVSSDIDLIFAYPQGGETDRERKPIDNHQFFTKLGQKLIHALDHVNGDGFVFRVDMRLRPYGSAGALALNFAAFEDYYQNQGREWERFAMVKGRIITGPDEDRSELRDIIRPFVYRRYADFSSIQALREMKRLIMSEVHRKGGERNIKLGNGGIREIEFIVQACQLIHGGRDQQLQRPCMLPLFEVLREQEYLPSEWVDQLLEANTFLRDMEHAIQGLADKQTQLIPDDDLERQQVAWSLGYASWDQALVDLDEHRSKVSRLFSAFLEEPKTERDDLPVQDNEWLRLWQLNASQSDWEKAFEKAGFAEPEKCFAAMEELRATRLFRAMSAEASQRLETFMPLLLSAAENHEHPERVFIRIMGLVKVILGRTIYLVLLYENPDALNLLCELCHQSPWVAEHLAKSPVILDELLDAHSLYQPPNRAELEDELRQSLLRIPEDDLEAQMDALRHFKQSHMLRVAAAELSGKLPLMKVSDYLTWLAEALVGKALTIAWSNMVAKYGTPGGLEGGAQVSGFGVIAYGKLGGIELNYHSDLDMVFIYQCDEQGMTKGERSIANPVFYTRLGQRLIHLLSTSTSQGELYEVDMRLRPSGNSGMLVSSLSAFERYQQQDAWTWEHQALVRARYIAGDDRVGVEFDRVRREVLSQKRDADALKEEVREMRFKMKAASADKFKSVDEAAADIKLGDGGLVDIEFITQYGVLSYASSQPGLMQWTDNIRVLETLAELKCFGGLNVHELIDAYRTLRSALHRKNLADQSYEVSLVDFEAQRDLVKKAWCHVFDVC